MTKIYSALIFIQFLFGLNFLASKYVIKNLSPAFFVSIRLLISALIMFAIFRVVGRKLQWSRKILLHSLWLGSLGFSLGQGLFIGGLKMTTAINASILSTTIPIFAILCNWIRGKTQLDAIQFVGFFFAFLGVLILRNVEQFGLEWSQFGGDVLILIACLVTGLFISLSREFFLKISPLEGSAFLFLAGGLVLLPISLFAPGSLFACPTDIGWFGASFAFAVIGATLLPYFLNNWALSKMSSDFVALFIFLQPVFASMLAWLIIGDQLTLRKGLSILAILIGMLLALKNGKERKAN